MAAPRTQYRPLRRTRINPQTRSTGEHPYFCIEVQKQGIFSSDTLRVLRFSGLVLQSFVGLITSSFKPIIKNNNP